MKFNRYLLPAIVAVLLLGGLIVAGNLLPNFRAKKTPATNAEEVVQIMSLPHGRVLYVVVDADGFYLGQESVPFILFQKYLKEHAEELKPDYVVVCGTESSRFGRAVEAIDSIRAVFKVPYTMETRTFPDGTRRGPIEVHEHPWEY